MVFQPEMRYVIAQAVNKVVLAIVVRAEQLLSLIDKALIVIEHLRRRFQCPGTIRRNVHLPQRILS